MQGFSMIAMLWATVMSTCLPISAGTETKIEQEDSIREVILRYQVAENDVADILFVEIQSSDPSDEFLHRLNDIRKPLKKKSLSRFGKNGHIQDRESEKYGVILHQGAIKWTGKSTVEVEGGYYCGMLCAGEYVYKLSLTGGKWKMRKAEAQWFS